MDGVGRGDDERGIDDGRSDEGADSVARALGLVLGLSVLLVALLGVHGLGVGPLAAPPLDPGAWGPWVVARGPLTAVVAVLRLVVLGLGWYLLVVTALGVGARLLRAVQLARLAEACALPVLRSVVRRIVGVSLATAITTANAAPLAALAASDLGPHPPVHTLVVASEPGASGDTRVVTGGSRPFPLELLERHRRSDVDHDDEGDQDRATADADAAAPEVDAGGADPDAVDPGVVDPGGVEPAATSEYLVVPGDSFWSIAQEVLANDAGHEPSDGDIAPYWSGLVEANRDRLVDRENADLLLPGQRLVLPAPDGPVA